MAEEPTYQPLNIDANGDGGISMEEYLNVAAKIFIRADTDFDGVLEKDNQDFSGVIQADSPYSLHLEASIIDQIYLFHKADSDGDGLVSEAEIATDLRRRVDEQQDKMKKLRARMEAIKAASQNNSGDGANTQSSNGQLIQRLQDETTHVLSEQELAELQMASARITSPDSETGVITLLSYQEGMRARFRVKDRNGDGQLTEDELSMGFLFSM